MWVSGKEVSTCKGPEVGLHTQAAFPGHVASGTGHVLSPAPCTWSLRSRDLELACIMKPGPFRFQPQLVWPTW